MRRRVRRRICAALIATVGFAAAGHGADPAAGPGAAVGAPEPRDDITIPYRRAYDMMDNVARAGGGLVSVALQLTAKDGRPVPGLKLWISSGTRRVPVAMDASGVFSLPQMPAAEIESALIHRNTGADLMLSVDFEPRVPRAAISAREASDIIAAGTRALHVAVPWYARPFVPAISGLGLCLATRAAAEAERARLLPDGPALPIVAEKARDTDAAPNYCIAITAGIILPGNGELRPGPEVGYQYLSTRL